jgi:uncharacterized membrane protein
VGSNPAIPTIRQTGRQAARPAVSPFPGTVVVLDSLLHWLGYGLCHQLPERSFFAGVHQVPVCARDTGIYLGFVLSVAVISAISRGRRPSELPPWGTLLLAVAFIGAMAADGVSSYAGWRTTTNDLRLATGLLAGYGMAALMLPILNGQLWSRPGRDRVLPDIRAALLWVATLPIAFAAIRWPFELLGIAYPIIVGVAILATFTMVNLTIVTLAPAAEGRSARLRDAWLWIVMAFGLTVVEVSASAWLRVVLTRIATGR